MWKKKMSSLLVIFSLQALKCKFTWENMISCAVFDMREFDLNKKTITYECM